MGTGRNKYHPHHHIWIRRMENDQGGYNADTQHLQRSTQGGPTTPARNPNNYSTGRITQQIQYYEDVFKEDDVENLKKAANIIIKIIKILEDRLQYHRNMYSTMGEPPSEPGKCNAQQKQINAGEVE